MPGFFESIFGTRVPRDLGVQKEVLETRVKAAEEAATKAEEHLKQLKEIAALKSQVAAADARKLKALDEARGYGSQVGGPSPLPSWGKKLIYGIVAVVGLLIFVALLRSCM